MKAIRDNIIVKPCISDEYSEGGLFVPEAFRERSNKAVIVSVGNGTKRRKMYLKEGQTIFHIKGAGTEFVENGEGYFIMKQQDVLAELKN